MALDRQYAASSAGPLRPYSDAQLNQGLWFLASNSCSDHFFAFTDVGLAEEQRLRGVRAIGALYALLFAKRCSAGRCQVVVDGL